MLLANTASAYKEGLQRLVPPAPAAPGAHKGIRHCDSAGCEAAEGSCEEDSSPWRTPATFEQSATTLSVCEMGKGNSPAHGSTETDDGSALLCSAAPPGHCMVAQLCCSSTSAALMKTPQMTNTIHNTPLLRHLVVSILLQGALPAPDTEQSQQTI